MSDDFASLGEVDLTSFEVLQAWILEDELMHSGRYARDGAWSCVQRSVRIPWRFAVQPDRRIETIRNEIDVHVSRSGETPPNGSGCGQQAETASRSDYHTSGKSLNARDPCRIQTRGAWVGSAAQ